MILIAQENLILEVVCVFLRVYYFILLARVIMSWLPNLPDGLRPVADFVFAMTEPVVRFARPLLPPLRIGGVALDLSIILIFFLLIFLQSVLCR